ncbi:adenylyltransferase/cytidyltransferase family protein [Devosia sp.]|uniref:adenylyltransferase/cytidyltransferase family protein n=1 Tax=Devosia sp. TaxID=1871048 RepID=UPI003F716845
MREAATAAPVWIYVDVVCDLFHHGHVEFFRRARALGDRLVVGLVGDADVASYKPPPILGFDERRAVVEACRHVDRVLDTPAPLHCTRAFLDAIGAHYVCHADDMSDEQLLFWYGDLARTGGLLKVPYTRSISSRQIVSRVVERYRAGTLRDS